VLHSGVFWGLCALMPWWYEGWLLPPMGSSAAFLFAAFLILFSARQRAVEAAAVGDRSDVVSSKSESS
ncbi:MAG: hypothetical protein Q8M35_07020, partial [Pseudohongiella sp.]|nr:hypothetical protein [Pseudohongiella sp.]